MKYTVYQAQLTDAQRWANSTACDAYMDITLCNDHQPKAAINKVLNAANAGLFRKTIIIDATDLEDMFNIGNGYGNPNGIIWTRRHNSVSVGNVAVDADGNGFICCAIGWTAISKTETSNFMNMVS